MSSKEILGHRKSCDMTEKLLKAALITTEHAVVLDRIREETSQYGVHCCVNCSSQTIQKGNWESSKRDAELADPSSYQVRG